MRRLGGNIIDSCGVAKGGSAPPTRTPDCSLFLVPPNLLGMSASRGCRLISADHTPTQAFRRGVYGQFGLQYASSKLTIDLVGAPRVDEDEHYCFAVALRRTGRTGQAPCGISGSFSEAVTQKRPSGRLVAARGCVDAPTGTR